MSGSNNKDLKVQLAGQQDRHSVKCKIKLIDEGMELVKAEIDEPKSKLASEISLNQTKEYKNVVKDCYEFVEGHPTKGLTLSLGGGINLPYPQ